MVPLVTLDQVQISSFEFSLQLQIKIVSINMRLVAL